jgi:hypothetical protein
VGEPALDQRLKDLHRAVNELFDSVNSRFGEVRDGLAAHRDPDPEVRLRLLQRVDVVEVTLLANDTLGVLTNFTQEITGHPDLLGAHAGLALGKPK